MDWDNWGAPPVDLTYVHIPEEADYFVCSFWKKEKTEWIECFIKFETLEEFDNYFKNITGDYTLVQLYPMKAKQEDC